MQVGNFRRGQNHAFLLAAANFNNYSLAVPLVATGNLAPALLPGTPATAYVNAAVVVRLAVVATANSTFGGDAVSVPAAALTTELTPALQWSPNNGTTAYPCAREPRGRYGEAQAVDHHMLRKMDFSGRPPQRYLLKAPPPPPGMDGAQLVVEQKKAPKNELFLAFGARSWPGAQAPRTACPWRSETPRILRVLNSSG